MRDCPRLKTNKPIPLGKLIQIANRPYPDDLIVRAYRRSTRKIPIGDSLATFICSELTETFDPKADYVTQLTRAVACLDVARDQLDRVRQELNQELISVIYI